MSNIKENRSEDKHAAKKTLVLGNAKKRGLPLLIAIPVVVFALIVGGLAVHSYLITPAQSGQTVSAQAAQEPSPTAIVTYDLKTFEDGKAHHFKHTAGDITIKYFILKSSDGVIRAAFDACDVCWPAGKGYYQEGDAMVCRNCGRRFASIKINEVSGGCNPAPLAREIKDEKVIIQVKEIITGKKYFTFT